ncbi:MAG: recombinase family protein [Dehalococcoidia bacterium]
MPERLRAVGYVRVSTEEQTEGHSLDAQRREIARHCERHAFDLVRIYADEGVSAHTEKIEKRPQLVALLDDAAHREFDVVIVHTIDRWARNVGVQRQALQRLGDAHVGFASVTENIDFTTPAGKLMLTMIGGVSEFFSDQLAVHVSKGQRERAESGLPIGPVPFGYITPGPGEVPTIEPEEGRAVQIAFERRAAGASYGEIARWLNSQGFEPRGSNEIFTPFAVKDMLKNAFYTGIVKYRSDLMPGQHEAIVTDELFERVLAKRHQAPTSRLTEKPLGLLQGRLHCGGCGRKVHSERNRRHEPRYRERHGSTCQTNGRSILASRVDWQLAELWRSIEFPADWRERIASIASRSYDGPDVTALQDKRRRLGRAYTEGAYGDAEYEALLRGIDDQIRFAANVAGPSYEEAAELLADMPALWDSAEHEERGRLLKPFLERVYLNMDMGLIGGLRPTPGFGFLLDHAVERVRGARVVILTSEETHNNASRVGLVETGEN